MRKGDFMEDISSGALAYLGDAVLELEVRRRLVTDKVKDPSAEALKYVTAAAQSDAVANIEGALTEEETDVYKRARNNYHSSNTPKSASAVQYRRATGFEAIFGYLYLKGEGERIKYLFNIAFGLE